MKKSIGTIMVALLLSSVIYSQETDNSSEDIKNPIVEKEIIEVDQDGNDVEEEEGGYGKITSKKYHNYFGLCSGLTYRYGISYRRWFMDDNFGLQLHVFPLIQKVYDEYDDEYYTTGKLKLGLTFLKGIKSYKYVRLLYYLNGTVSYDVDYEYNWQEDYDYDYEQTEEFSVGAATGPGFEFYFWRFSVDVFLGVSGKYNIDTEEYHVLPAAETALHFRF